MNFVPNIPDEIIHFLLVLVFSLLIGLEQRRHHSSKEAAELFGTDRTFTFIGLLGYLLIVVNEKSFVPFLTGFIILGLLLGIHYYLKIKEQQKYGLTSIILALLTYSIPLLIMTQPIWLTLSFVVAILVITEMKDEFVTIMQKVSQDEFITLAKFIAFAGIILPLLPHENISDSIPVSPYHIWLAIVVVSGISYASYLLKKLVFPKSSLTITGILGGLYSSTATTVILARKEKSESLGAEAVSAIMMANGMMYLRILLLAFLFNTAVALRLVIPFLLLFVVSMVLSRTALMKAEKQEITGKQVESTSRNPLEFRTALVFGLLFVLFGLITHYVSQAYGSAGVTTLAFVVGVTDIDPFLMNLLQQKSTLDVFVVALAILNATNSNNLLKMMYALSLSSKTVKRRMSLHFGILLAAGILCSVWFYVIK
ncbi:MgtC/SapB family protein [Prolixibacter sp. NT017]|uniref:MgtC/SapB family protein n=1 Tax=Prolixibacter sp. NT017 TaxID=2652390 RepID=UPI001279A671|nr:DUF4010 domain-containing protein [Prolixibacter sp. NT017]GET24288.1 hypothetical protein NT017_06170 [Prolixibacter sp. NT017]